MATSQSQCSPPCPGVARAPDRDQDRLAEVSVVPGAISLLQEAGNCRVKKRSG